MTNAAQCGLECAYITGGRTAVGRCHLPAGHLGPCERATPAEGPHRSNRLSVVDAMQEAVQGAVAPVVRDSARALHESIIRGMGLERRQVVQVREVSSAARLDNCVEWRVRYTTPQGEHTETFTSIEALREFARDNNVADQMPPAMMQWPVSEFAHTRATPQLPPPGPPGRPRRAPLEAQNAAGIAAEEELERAMDRGHLAPAARVRLRRELVASGVLRTREQDYSLLVEAGAMSALEARRLLGLSLEGAVDDAAQGVVPVERTRTRRIRV